MKSKLVKESLQDFNQSEINESLANDVKKMAQNMDMSSDETIAAGVKANMEELAANKNMPSKFKAHVDKLLKHIDQAPIKKLKGIVHYWGDGKSGVMLAQNGGKWILQDIKGTSTFN